MNQAPETAGYALSEGKQLDGERVIEKGDTYVSVEFSVPDTSPYFDGHFPGFPILPAIAQIELVIRFTSYFFGTGIDVSEIRRVKFMNFIKPFTPLVLKLEKDEKTISYRMYSPNGEIVYSTGTFKLRENCFPEKSL